MTRALFDTTLAAAKDLHKALPGLNEFVPWPDDLTWSQRPARAIPALDHLCSDPGEADDATRPLRDALCALAPHIDWRQTYTESQVGRDFLNRYGWFELAGPNGHFLSRQVRMTVGYWGRNLYYPWHQHDPEELYCVISGQGLFEAKGEDAQTLGPPGTKFHGSDQSHALTTGDAPILTFVLWRGDVLDAPLRMGGDMK